MSGDCPTCGGDASHNRGVKRENNPYFVSCTDPCHGTGGSKSDMRTDAELAEVVFGWLVFEGTAFIALTELTTRLEEAREENVNIERDYNAALDAQDAMLTAQVNEAIALYGTVAARLAGRTAEVARLRRAAGEIRRIIVGLPPKAIEAILKADTSSGYMVDVLDAALHEPKESTHE